MQRDDVLNSGDPFVASRGFAAWRDEMLLALAARRTAGAATGRLTVQMPSGRARTFGSGGGTEATLHIRSMKALWRGITRGAVGFAESYVSRELECPDMGQLLRFYLDNHAPIAQAGAGLFETRSFDRAAHRRRSNTREGSRRNIAAHYDLGNEFYALWLDPTMTYSSALFDGHDLDLETAQEAKYAAVLSALGVKAGERVLEIGCGWGGMAERIARTGADVTAITVSAEQLAFARDRFEAAGLGDRIDARFEDYRDVKGAFARIVSIEMIEAVGEEHWDAYFRVVRDRLTSGGSAVIQAITINERDYPHYRATPDFIQRYIFPGGMLPTVTLMRQHAEAFGLQFEKVVTFGQDYARTLRLWRERFEAAWPMIAKMGFDDRFRRMWNYYLVYCEVGFERGVVDVGLYRLVKA
ncbi:MAG: cyclopropane-fatty-acyl-phospholipid synthase family protein [Hyphomicrobium sp.]|nr:cyclopropane-fatty-acyl-phospholipid synthase family protein [Hyphomicrobium sp.]